MRKIFIICFLFACFLGKINAQVPDTLLCDYPDRDTTEAELLPWFGNNDYLENFLDSIGRCVDNYSFAIHIPNLYGVAP